MDTPDPRMSPRTEDNPQGYVPCKATNSKGQRCRKRPIAGGTVCATHGGSAPQVKRKAALRLAALVDPAIATLGREMVNADKSSDRQRAANSILDRAGYPRTSKVETEDAKDILLSRLMEMRAEALERMSEGGESSDEPQD